MTITDIAVRQPAAALAIRPGQDMFDAKQRAALEVLGIKGASNADMAVFMHVCQRTGLDPFSRQIYYIFRGGRWVIQTGIGGYQVIRDRVAERLGIDVEYEDTVWYDALGQAAEVWLDPEPPAACKVVVRKAGKRFPAIVLWREVAALKDGKPQSEWSHQPAHMLEKCAEAAALRRAFPQDLSGLYTDDEMPPPETVQVRSERVTAADILADSPPPTAADDAPHRTQAGKPALDRLTDLTGRVLGAWPDDEVTVLYERVAGHQWTGAKTDVQLVSTLLADALKAAGDDPEAAAASLWQQFHPEDGAG